MKVSRDSPARRQAAFPGAVLALAPEQSMMGKELNLSLVTKFQRTFVRQIEALQKLKGKGGQKVTVEHVHLHESGQAIVGNVNHAPEGGDKNGN